jgi:polar amino acid transport system permease protein
VKESSVLSIITVSELTMASSIVLGQTFAAVEAYSVVALLYWGLALAIALAMGSLERWTPGRRRVVGRLAPLLSGSRES